jgi:hypothetical protein
MAAPNTIGAAGSCEESIPACPQGPHLRRCSTRDARRAAHDARRGVSGAGQLTDLASHDDAWLQPAELWKLTRARYV